MFRNMYKSLVRPHLEYASKKGGKDQDTTWKSDKNTIKHHKQEPRGQPFPSR